MVITQTKQKFSTQILSVFFVLLAIPALLSAKQLPIPEMKGPVNDLANVLSTQEKQKLESYLSSINTQTGVQIAVLTVKTLAGTSIEDYSMKVAEKWQLGQAKTDNGVLLLVAVQDRALRIEVGYGLEGVLTDMKSGLIIRNVITPEFKKGNYSQGIYAGVQNIAGVATNNAGIVSEDVKNPKANEQSGSGLVGLIFMIIFFVIMTGNRRGRSGGLFWPIVFGSMLSRGSRNSSSRGFGGGSSGGFGGFSGGGGSFGGGGASGGW